VIVSHEHVFVFLKTEKTAGTSVEIALSRSCGPCLEALDDERVEVARILRVPESMVLPRVKANFRPDRRPIRGSSTNSTIRRLCMLPERMH
jgi:hypothetical protein